MQVGIEQCSVVVPTVGRPSLDVLLDALAQAPGPRPAELVLVDDRPTGEPLHPERPGLPPVRVVRTGGGGPARARNLGWRTARTAWIAFLDDDVVPDPDWYQRLAEDLAGLPADVAGSQGRVRVPLPQDRRPTDWERGTAGLATSSWITADLAYRRAALAAVGGFDERFPRAFREDSDLALRVMDTGARLVRGRRRGGLRGPGPHAGDAGGRGRGGPAASRHDHRGGRACPGGWVVSRTVLVARLDSVGDVLVQGPLVRAVAAGADRVVFLAGPAGAEAAWLLPGVDEVWTWACPWILGDPPPVDADDLAALTDRVRALAPDEAVVSTSFHQSPLPLALLLRAAGVPRISAISVDYPGSLLDVRHAVDDDLPEPERALSLARAAGFELPSGDDGLLAVRRPLPPVAHEPGYVVLHPGASVPARAWPAGHCAQAVEALTDAGYRVLVTGGPDERGLTAAVAGTRGVDLGGAL